MTVLVGLDLAVAVFSNRLACSITESESAAWTSIKRSEQSSSPLHWHAGLSAADFLLCSEPQTALYLIFNPVQPWPRLSPIYTKTHKETYPLLSRWQQSQNPLHSKSEVALSGHQSLPATTPCRGLYMQKRLPAVARSSFYTVPYSGL